MNKGRCDGIVGNRRSVFAKELAKEFAVGRINLGCGGIFRMHDAGERRRAPEKPKEVDLNGKAGEEDEKNEGEETDAQLLPPRCALVKGFIPTPQAHRRTEDPDNWCN